MSAATAMVHVAEQPRDAASAYTREQVETLKATVARGASDSQLALFLEVCNRRQIDPFTRQAHWTSQGIIVGIDGFRAIADRTGAYVPGPTTYEHDERGQLIAAHVTVRKYVAGGWHDITESAYLCEYQGRTPVWKTMPRVMLAKCAEARALRRAFPADLSGLYAAEEMDQAQARERDPQPVRAVAQRQPESERRVELEAHVVEVEADTRAVDFAGRLETAESVEALVAIGGEIRGAGLSAGDVARLKGIYNARRRALAGEV